MVKMEERVEMGNRVKRLMLISGTPMESSSCISKLGYILLSVNPNSQTVSPNTYSGLSQADRIKRVYNALLISISNTSNFNTCVYGITPVISLCLEIGNPH